MFVDTTALSAATHGHSLPFAQPSSNPAVSPFPLPGRGRFEQHKRMQPRPASLCDHIPHRSRCYWAVLALPESQRSATSPPLHANAPTSAPASPLPSDIGALEIIYVDPSMQAHLGQAAAEHISGQRFFDLVHSDDLNAATHDMADLLGPGRTTFGSVIRCRFANTATLRSRILDRTSHSPAPQHRPHHDSGVDYPLVDLVISYIGEGLALCFIHNVIDETPFDSDEQNKSDWSNWCGMPADLFDANEADLLWRQITQRRASVARPAAPEHIFQILRTPQEGGQILFSWPPPRLFPASVQPSSDDGGEQAAQLIAHSALTQYRDGSYFADDFAALAQGLDASLFALSDASTTCTRRLRAKHTLSTDGMIRTVESVVIGYGSIMIAMFTNSFQAPIAALQPPSDVAVEQSYPAIIPMPSQLQPDNTMSAAAIATSTQVALMSQSPTTLSPVLLQQTLSPRQSDGGRPPSAGAAGMPTGFVAYHDTHPNSAPAVSASFSQSGVQVQNENLMFNSRRSFDESFLAPHARAKSSDKAVGWDDRRMSDTSFNNHRRAVTFNPDTTGSAGQGRGLSQHQQLLMESEADLVDGASNRRFRNPSQASYASSNFSNTLSTISSYDSLATSIASTETMFSPRPSVKWGSISGETAGPSGPGVGHRDSSASVSGLDAAAIAAATAAAAAAGARRRSRQETWPLARIDDEALIGLGTGADQGAYLSSASASQRSRSISAAVLHTDGNVPGQVNANLAVLEGPGQLIASPVGAPLDPSSAAATAAAAAAVAAAAGNSASALLPTGISGNSLNPFAAAPSPTAPAFSFGASPDVRPTLELPPVDPLQPLQPNGAFGLPPPHDSMSLPSSSMAVSAPPMITETFDPSAGLHGGGPFVSSFAPHCRAMSAPGLGLNNGLPISSTPYSMRGAHVHGVGKEKEKHICASCGTTNSPEWRKGPSGVKTLCNACGLRYSRSVVRAKKREEKRKASEPSLRRASEVAAAATTAAASAAAAAAASAAASKGGAGVVLSHDMDHDQDGGPSSGRRRTVTVPASFHSELGPASQPMAGVISSEGHSPDGGNGHAFGLQPMSYSAGNGSDVNEPTMLGFQPPFVRAETSSSTNSGSTGTSYTSSNNSFINLAGGGLHPSFASNGSSLHGSAASSVTTLGSYNSSSGPDGGEAAEARDAIKADHINGMPMPMSGEGVVMDRTSTADWMPFSSFEQPQQYDVDITV